MCAIISGNGKQDKDEIWCIQVPPLGFPSQRAGNAESLSTS